MSNWYDNSKPGPLGPATDLEPLPRDDAQDLVRYPIGIRINAGTGALRVLTAQGNDRSFNVTSGDQLPLAIARVFDTGTDPSIEVLGYMIE